MCVIDIDFKQIQSLTHGTLSANCNYYQWPSKSLLISIFQWRQLFGRLIIILLSLNFSSVPPHYFTCCIFLWYVITVFWSILSDPLPPNPFLLQSVAQCCYLQSDTVLGNTANCSLLLSLELLQAWMLKRNFQSNQMKGGNKDYGRN